MSDATPADPLAPWVRSFAAGERIFEQGDAGDRLYFIRRGRVRISKVSHKCVHPLAVLEPGTFFGEMAVLTGEPQSAGQARSASSVPSGKSRRRASARSAACKGLRANQRAHSTIAGHVLLAPWASTPATVA